MRLPFQSSSKETADMSPTNTGTFSTILLAYIKEHTFGYYTEATIYPSQATH